MADVGYRYDRVDYLERVRTSYDEVAADYATLVGASFPQDRLGRALLGLFAQEVLAADASAPVLEIGCGPGHVTAYLAELGLAARGVDLSGQMVQLARQAHPALRFEQGDMTALDLEPGTLGGVLLWYSTHHLRPEWLPGVFTGCARALRVGGTLLLGTHVGAGEHTKPSQAYGTHPVSYESFLRPADELVAMLEDAGLRVTSVTTGRQDPRAAGKQRAGARIFATKDAEQPE